MAMSNTKVISRHLFSEKHRGLLPQFEENNGFGRSFTWPFQIRWYWRWPLNWPEQTSRAVSHWKCLIPALWAIDFSDGGKSELKTWASDGGFDLPTSQAEILGIITNFVDSALGQTQSYDWKTPRSAQKSHSLCQFQPLVVTFCIGTKQNHDPRDTDCNRNEAAITSQWTLAPMS